MNYTVPLLSIVCMAFSALMGAAIPVALFLVFRKKFKADISPFFTGCAVFIVFAILIEGTINSFILSSSVGAYIKSNIWIYGIFGGFMAGLFEETGRFAAFKTVLKRKRGKDANALMYGAGHGGVEAFYILVFSMVSNIVLAVTLNAGGYEKLIAGATTQAAQQTLNATIAALSGLAPATFLLSTVERAAAVAFHISASVLVWFAAKDKRRFLLYPLALVLHMLLDMIAVILGRHVSNLWIVLGAIYVYTALCVLIARAVWKKCASARETPPEAEAGVGDAGEEAI